MQTIGIKHLLAGGALAAVLAVTAGAALAQPPSQVLRVGPASRDGDTASYAVKCTNGTRGTVYVQHKTSQYCAIASGGKPRCATEWSLREASQHACKAAAK